MKIITFGGGLLWAFAKKGMKKHVIDEINNAWIKATTRPKSIEESIYESEKDIKNAVNRWHEKWLKLRKKVENETRQ